MVRVVMAFVMMLAFTFGIALVYLGGVFLTKVFKDPTHKFSDGVLVGV